MNYLSAENITKIYGAKTLFENISFKINKGQKIALVAKNGTGKSSLIKILVGEDSSDKGGIVRISKHIKMGYTQQEPNLNPNDTVLESIFHSNNPTLTVIHQYEQALVMHESKPNQQTEAALSKALEAMQLHNAWDYEAKIKEILSKFNIRDVNQRVAELSGGERKRVAMASVLIQDPDLLIMDEPTNHLDLEMIEWLESFLNKQNLTILLVTHDRYFLNRVTDEILELDDGVLKRYRGNYEYFLEKKYEDTERLKVETDKAQKLMKKELVWIRNQPKARGTKAKSRVDAFDNIKAKASAKIQDDDLDFEAIDMARIGGKTVEMFHVHKSYDSLKILEDFTYVFARRDRAGIVGRNGAGKSTFLNLITGKEKPDQGKIVIGQTVVFGYYHQQGLNLKEDKKVIDVVREVAEILPLKKGKYLTADQLLAHFQFPHAIHQNYISTLSGGEKRRLYLLTVLMENPNFLILDEPTNDLDLLTLNLLEDFLEKFKGCLIVVSHDRYFMDKLVDHVFAFEGDGVVRDYPGNYSQYRTAKNKEIATERERLKLERDKQEKETPAKKKDKPKTKLSYNEQREFKQLEVDMEKLEAEKDELETKISSGTANIDDIMQWSERMGKIAQLIDEKTDRWLELSEYV